MYPIDEFRPECIKVEKVYNSCRVAKCPVIPRPVVRVSPPADAFLNCEIVPDTIGATGLIPARDRVVVAFQADVIITYLDTTGNQVTTPPTTIRHTQTLALTGAIPGIGMMVQIEPDGGIMDCLDGRVINGGNAIELDIGICAVVKVTLLVQLEVLGRFCPLPETCEVLPSPCTAFLERCETLELFPPQPEADL